MKTRLLSVILVVGWVAAFAQTPWSAPSDVNVILTSITVPGGTCLGEDVTFTGVFTVEIVTTTDAAGNVHIRSTLPHFNVTGIGSNGGQYTVLSLSKQVETISSDGANTESQTWRLKLIGQGATNNETFFLTVHVTLPGPNSNGFGVNVNHIGSRCTG